MHLMHLNGILLNILFVSGAGEDEWGWCRGDVYVEQTISIIITIQPLVV